jgi:hypothetical protein
LELAGGLVRLAIAVRLLAVDLDSTVRQQLTDRLEFGRTVVNPYLRWHVRNVYPRRPG